MRCGRSSLPSDRRETALTDTVHAPDPQSLRSFAEFYPFYLGEHRNRTCRRLHFAGSTLSLACLGALVATGNAWFVAAALASGYGFAWIGHFVFEKNRPASFKRPLWSFLGDWRMYADIWRGRIPF
jgi:hypothetical protein